MDKQKSGRDSNVKAEEVCENVKEYNKHERKHKYKSLNRVGQLVSKLIAKSPKHTADKKTEKSGILSSRVKRRLDVVEGEPEKKKRKKLFDMSLKISSKKDLETSKSKYCKDISSSVPVSQNKQKIKARVSEHARKTKEEHTQKTKEQLRVEKDMVEIFGCLSPPLSETTSGRISDTKSKSSQKETKNDSCKLNSDLKKCNEKKKEVSKGGMESKRKKDKGSTKRASGKNNKKKAEQSCINSCKQPSTIEKVDKMKQDSHSHISGCKSLSETTCCVKDSGETDNVNENYSTELRTEHSNQTLTEEGMLLERTMLDVKSSRVAGEAHVQVKESEPCGMLSSVVSSKVDISEGTQSVGAYSSRISDSSNSCDALHLRMTDLPQAESSGSCQSSRPPSRALSLRSQGSSRLESAQTSLSGSPCGSGQSSRSNSRHSSVSRSKKISVRVGSRSSSRQSLHCSNSPTNETLAESVGEKTGNSLQEAEVIVNLKQNSRNSSKHSSRSSSPGKDCPGMEQLRLLSEQLSKLDAVNALLPSPLYRQPTPTTCSTLPKKSMASPRSLVTSGSPRKSLKNSPFQKKYLGVRSPKFSPLRHVRSPRMSKSPDKSRLKRRLYDMSPLKKMSKRRKVESPMKKPKKKLQVQFSFGSHDSSPGSDWVSDTSTSSASCSPGDGNLSEGASPASCSSKSLTDRQLSEGTSPTSCSSKSPDDKELSEGSSPVSCSSKSQGDGQLSEGTSPASCSFKSPGDGQLVEEEEYDDEDNDPQYFPDSAASSDSSDDAEEDQLAIDCDGLMDLALNNKSNKLKLTARNVKSIISEVIKNEHVSELFRKSLVDNGWEDQLMEAIFEPKMTRARVKEVIENGNFPPPWTLSPIKGLKQVPKEVKPCILDINFSDNEDDQEYRPTTEELEQTDDDDLSMMSSQASDLGSPLLGNFRQAPSTPKDMVFGRKLFSEGNSTPKSLIEPSDTEDEELMAERTRSKLPLKDTPLDVLESNFVAPDITPDMYDTSCNDKDWTCFLESLNKEEQLNETYDDEQNDPEFNFLAEQEQEELDKEDYRDDKAVRISKKELNELMDELFEAYGGADLLDEDENTKDSMNFSQESVQLAVQNTPCEKSGREEWRTTTPCTSSVSEESDPTTRATTVVSIMPPPATAATVTRLKYPGHLPPLKLDPKLASLLVSDIIKIQTKAKEEEVDTPITELTKSLAMSSSEVTQLQDQLRKHVQLLCQTYIQSVNQSTLQNVSNMAKGYLRELECLGEKSLRNGFSQSYFHTPNLKEAIELTHMEFEEDSPEVRSKVKEKMVYRKVMTGPNFELYGLSMWQMGVFVNRKVFMFPQMLPENKFPREDFTKNRRVAFTEAEDYLLIFGLEQFQYMANKFNYIQRFLLPCKTQDQIRTHCKNLRGKRKQKVPSALQEYLKTKQMPHCERYLELEEVSKVVPPRQRDPKLLPTWWPVYVEIEKERDAGENRFIPINPDLADDAGQRQTPTYPALLKAKKLSKHDPTDDTVGLSGLQHFKRTSSSRVSRSNSRSNSPFKDIQQVTPAVTRIKASEDNAQEISPDNQTAEVTKKQCHRDSVSSTDSAKSEMGNIVSDTAPAVIEGTLPTINNNGAVSSAFSSLTKTQSGSHQFNPAALSTTTSDVVKHSSSSSSKQTQPCLNKHALGTSLPDIDMNITSELDAIQPSVTFNATTATMSLSEAAIFSNSSTSESTLSTRISTMCSTDSPGAPSAVNVSTPQLIRVLCSQASTPSTEVALKTPSKAGGSPVTSMGSPSLIGSAMAEALGVTVSELNTPEGIRKMGITPSKVPGLVQSQGERKPDVRKSLSAVYEAQTEQPNMPSTPQPKVDTVVEEKNKNLILGILQENPKKPTCGDVRLSNPSTNIPDTPEKQSSPVTSSQVTPISERLSRAVDFFKISPVDLNLIAENSTIFPDKPIQRLSDFDTENTLVTPRKVNFEDFYKGSPSSSRHSAGDSNKFNQSLPFGITALSTPDTPSKTALKLMARLAQEIQSPEKPPSTASEVLSVSKTSIFNKSNSPLKALPEAAKPSQVGVRSNDNSPAKTPPKTPSEPFSTPPLSCQGRRNLSFAGQISPKRSTPIKIRPLLPDGPLPKTPEKSPMFQKTKTTPRRKILKQNARAIAPKGVIQFATYVSPVKQVAAALSARAKNYVSPQKKPPGRLRTILPKSPKTQPTPPPTGKRRIFSPTLPGENSLVEKDVDFEEENADGVSDREIEEEFVMTRRQRRLLKKQRTERLKEEEDKENDTPGSDGGGVGGGGQDSQEEMDEDEQDHLAQLMAASTTIRFDPRQQENPQLRSKGQIKKDTILEMLAPDLLEADPIRDEKDTAFAQSFIKKVRDSLKNEPEKYHKFLNLLYEFGSCKSSPVDLYTEMYHLFAGHPELLEDFTSFLLPDQAKECGCLMAHLEFQKARTFLRQLEVHFKRLPGMLQRVLKSFAKWESLPTKNIKDLQDEIRPLLKGQQYLLDEFATFFEDDRVPDSYMTDFEEVNILSGDEETADPYDGYEEVTIPGGDDSLYGSKLCPCQCHSNADKPDYRERKKHCISCGIKIIKGRLYLQCDNKLRPLHIKYSQSSKMADQGISEEQEEEGAEDVEELELNDEEDEELEGEVDDEEKDELEDDVEDDEEVLQDEEKEDEDITGDVEDDEEMIKDEDEEIAVEDEEVIEGDEDIEEDDEEEKEGEETAEDVDVEEEEKDSIVEENGKDGMAEDAEMTGDDEEAMDDDEEDKDDLQDEDDGVEEVEFNDDEEEEELSLSEEDGEDKETLGDDEDEEFSSDEDQESDGEQLDGDEEDCVVESSEVNDDVNTEKKSAEESDKNAQKSSKDKCDVQPSKKQNRTDFSTLTKEIQFDRQHSDSASLGLCSTGSNQPNFSSVTKTSEKTSDTSSTSRIDSNSGSHTGTSLGESGNSQPAAPGPPVVVDEAASFNLVTQPGARDFRTSDSVLKEFTPTMDQKSLFGELSDTEDTLMASDKKPVESTYRLKQESAESEDTDTQGTACSGVTVKPTTTGAKWSMEEDRLILNKVRVSGPSDQIFRALALLLGKTAQQVEVRFATLLALLTSEEETDDGQSEEN